MSTVPRVLHRPATPISVHEFVAAVKAVCRPRFPGCRSMLPQTVGLAISGGVDSMALAYLCSRLRREYQGMIIADNPLSNFAPAIVDHQARDGSAEEARAVAEVLSGLGFKARVLAPSWQEYLHGTEYTHPKDLPNFETVARRVRYRALAKCFSTQTNAAGVFLAHHQDDQYETLLMRLVNGSRAAGLHGMSPAADMPECYGIHRIYQSGFVDDQLSKDPVYNFRPTIKQYKSIKAQLRQDIDPKVYEQERVDGVLSGGYLENEFDAYVVDKRPSWGLPAVPLDVEDGGLMIYRPLLEFSKDRLIATCEANKVPWFEDHTNSDPMLTRRNAVRHLVKNHTLPVALQKPAILAVSNRLRRKAEADEAEIDRLLLRTIVRDFDSTSGTLVVRPPTFRIPRRHRLSKEALKRRIDHYRHIAEVLLKKLVAMIKPEMPGSITSNLQAAVLHLFPSLSDNPSMYPEHPKSFVTAGIHFLPVRTSDKGGRLHWYLAREPFVSHWPQPIRVWSGLAFNQRWRRRPDQWRWPQFKKFQLWDGRIWIRMINRSSLSAGVIPFDEKDANAFRKSLPRGPQRDQLAALLKSHAPGKVRWTIPAIYTIGRIEDVLENYERYAQKEKALWLDEAEARKDWEKFCATHGHNDAEEAAEAWEREKGFHSTWKATWKGTKETKTWEEKYFGNDTERVLVALPTLGIAKPGISNWLKWEIRYKKADMNLLKKSAKNEDDLARYEKARRKARRTNMPTSKAEYFERHKRRKATTDALARKSHVRISKIE